MSCSMEPFIFRSVKILWADTNINSKFNYINS